MLQERQKSANEWSPAQHEITYALGCI